MFGTTRLTSWPSPSQTTNVVLNPLTTTTHKPLGPHGPTSLF